MRTPTQCDYDAAAWQESPGSPWYWEVIYSDDTDDKTLDSGIEETEEEARGAAARALRKAWEVVSC